MKPYPKITDEMVSQKDFYNNPANAVLAMENLKDLCFNHVSQDVTAGASGATVTEYAFVAPTKLQIVKANFLVVTPQEGTGNTPTVKVQVGSDDVAASAAIALSGSAGDVKALVVDQDKKVIAAGSVIKFAIVNPAGTITTALKGKFQVEWNAIP